MKKLLLILTGVGITLAALAGAGLAFAQGPTPPTAPNPQNPDGFGHRGDRFNRMEDTPLHDVMSAALADAFGITVEEIEIMHENGENLWTFAEGQGLTEEEFQAKMIEARENALRQAVEEELISQEQADWMLSRWENARNSEYGPGRGPCQDGEATPQAGSRGMRGGQGKGIDQ